MHSKSLNNLKTVKGVSFVAYPGLKDHPNHDIAKKLRDINLSPKPIFFQYVPVMEAILYGPRNLMDD